MTTKKDTAATPSTKILTNIMEALDQDPVLTEQVWAHIMANSVGQRQNELLDPLVTNTVLNQRIDEIAAQLAVIQDNQYRQQAAWTAVQLAATELGLQGPAAIFSKFGPAHRDFHTSMQASLVSQKDLRNLFQADLIIWGSNRRHAAAAISLNPNRKHIEEILHCSETLHKVTAEHVAAVIVTAEPTQRLIDEAGKENIKVINVPA